MLRRLAISVARALPVSFKNWIHNNRTIDRFTRRTFASLSGAGGGPSEIENGPMKGIRLRPSEHVSHAHLSGDYERDVQEAVDRLVQPGFVCYDLGASIGYLSLLMARKAKHVYAFEPAPHAASEMKKQIEANGFSNITVLPDPVSDTKRQVTFSLTDVAYGSCINESETKWPTITLTTTTLDEFASKNGPPDFIKIDVEGQEGPVLRGAETILAQRRARICCEVHTHEAAVEVQEVLTRHGYSITTLDGTPFTVHDGIIPGMVQVIAIPGGGPSAGR